MYGFVTSELCAGNNGSEARSGACVQGTDGGQQGRQEASRLGAGLSRLRDPGEYPFRTNWENQKPQATPESGVRTG
jgi:hypothetical protein